MAPSVETPESVAEVVASLREGDVVIAGGTEVMPRVTTRSTGVTRLVSLRRAGMAGIEVDERPRLDRRRDDAGPARPRGAGLPCLQPVVESIASPTIRNLATVGGNLFVEQPYGDFAVALLALDARRRRDRAGSELEPASR